MFGGKFDALYSLFIKYKKTDLMRINGALFVSEKLQE